MAATMAAFSDIYKSFLAFHKHRMYDIYKVMKFNSLPQDICVQIADGIAKSKDFFWRNTCMALV